MKTIDDVPQINRPGRIRLFDQDGLPWASRLHWGTLLFWVGAILFFFAPLVGIYLGLWLISKGRSAFTLVLYLVLAITSIPTFFAPFPTHSSTVETALGLTFFVLWLVGAFVLRREVMGYYSGREGIPFPLNPVLTVLFGPWYVSGL